ncbi:MAG: CoA ester lyase [Pseudomonadota bacterium]
MKDTAPSSLHRPRRSALYMPASKARALEKARSLDADVLLLDLEDAVAPDEKPAARKALAASLAEGGFGSRETVVRVNALGTPWGGDDLAMAARSGADAVLLPKVESSAMVEAAAAALDNADGPQSLALWAMIETPRGILAAERIARHPRLACFVLGTNDLVADMRAEHVPGRAPVLAALTMAVLAARASGLAVLDGVYNAFRDEEGLRAECEQGRALGMDGKTLIHPAQLAIANEVFAPAEDAVALARRQIEAYEEARAQGQGVAVVDGRIVENLHVRTAQRLIAEAEAIERRAATAR